MKHLKLLCRLETVGYVDRQETNAFPPKDPHRLETFEKLEFKTQAKEIKRKTKSAKKTLHQIKWNQTSQTNSACVRDRR